MKKKLNTKKRLFNKLVSMVLAAVMVLNVNITALQANAMSRNDTANKWTSSAKDNLNVLPQYAQGTDGLDRVPDIGKAVDNAHEIVSDSKNKTTASVQEHTVTVSRQDNILELTPKDGSFDRGKYTDCAVRYTDVLQNIDYQFASLDGEAQIKVLCRQP